MNVRRAGGIWAESSSPVSGRCSWSRPLASTRSVWPDSEFDSYLMTACGLIFAVVLVVGAGGYADIQRLSSSTATTAKLATLEQLNREVDPDRIFTPAAIGLAVIAVFLIAIPARAASSRRYSIE
jgi:hypothetical protein